MSLRVWAHAVLHFEFYTHAQRSALNSCRLWDFYSSRTLYARVGDGEQ